MRTALLLVSTIILAACSTSGSSERGEYSVESGLGAPPPAEERTFSCPRSMSDCRSQAENHCGEAGYTRVRTPTDMSARMNEVGHARVGAGRAGTSPEEIRQRGGPVGDDVSRTMTVRCKPPPSEE